MYIESGGLEALRDNLFSSTELELLQARRFLADKLVTTYHLSSSCGVLMKPVGLMLLKLLYAHFEIEPTKQMSSDATYPSVDSIETTSIYKPMASGEDQTCWNYLERAIDSSLKSNGAITDCLPCEISEVVFWVRETILEIQV